MGCTYCFGVDGMNGEEGGAEQRGGGGEAETVAAEPGEQGADQGVQAHVDRVVTPRLQTAHREIPSETIHFDHFRCISTFGKFYWIK